jgi:dipeptidyl aminopeptidase/acylaminoacyl peptidase
MTSSRMYFVTLLAALACWPPAAAAENIRSFDQVAISPGGHALGWVGPGWEGQGQSTLARGIYVLDLTVPNSTPQRITAAENTSASETDIAWSPDGNEIAFLSDAASLGQSQVYVAPTTGGAARKLTSLTGDLSSLSWSPDGKSIAFLFTENAPRTAGPLMPMTPETGVIGSKVYEQRLAVVEVASGRVRQLSPPDLYVYEYDWSPDGTSFAVTAASGEGDANWYVARLYALTVANAEIKVLYKPALQIAVPRWSPDGKNVALIGGLMSDEGSTGGDIFLVPVDGSEVRNLTPGMPASASGLHWESPDRILFAEDIDGESGIATVESPSGRISQLWSGPEVMREEHSRATDISLSADHGKAAAILHSSEQPPELWAGPPGKWKQISSVNDHIKPPWGQAKSLHWMNHDRRVQGWLMYPKDYDPKQRYPMVVVPHGGPASMFIPGWPGRFFNTNELSSQGYFVLYPNPRGSYGQGEAFTQANVKDFGYGDLQDILAGVDEVVKTLPVDNDRIGITGWSYGGYMTMWAVTQSHRFRAAVSGAGLADFLSYYGENDIDEWMIPYFGASVYDDPAVYARSSPITFIRNVKTPTLVVVGERDGECPAPQSREFWHALKTLGVETQYVVYAGEGHAFLEADHQRDVTERMIAWFDRYLKAGAEAQGQASRH